MAKQVEMFTVTAKIPGFWGRIIPEIELSMQKQILYGVTSKVVRKTIRREMRKYMTDPAPEPDTDLDTATAPALETDTIQ